MYSIGISILLLISKTRTIDFELKLQIISPFIYPNGQWPDLRLYYYYIYIKYYVRYSNNFLQPATNVSFNVDSSYISYIY